MRRCVDVHVTWPVPMLWKYRWAQDEWVVWLDSEFTQNGTGCGMQFNRYEISDTGRLFAMVSLKWGGNICPFIHVVISERVVHWCTWNWNWPQLERTPAVVVVLTMLTMMAFLCTRFSNVIRWFTYIHIFMFSSHIFTWVASARTSRRRSGICLLNKNIFVKWTEQEEVNTGTSTYRTMAPLLRRCASVCANRKTFEQTEDRARRRPNKNTNQNKYAAH